MSLGQQQLHTTVLQHVGQAITRILGVQRHISATGLEHRQQANHHLHRALCRQPHQHIRANPGRHQAMCQAIGPGVQRAVTQGLPRENQGRCIRCTQHLSLDQRVDRLIQRVIHRSRIPIMQYPLPLGLRH